MAAWVQLPKSLTQGGSTWTSRDLGSGRLNAGVSRGSPWRRRLRRGGRGRRCTMLCPRQPWVGRGGQAVCGRFRDSGTRVWEGGGERWLRLLSNPVSCCLRFLGFLLQTLASPAGGAVREGHPRGDAPRCGRRSGLGWAVSPRFLPAERPACGLDGPPR